MEEFFKALNDTEAGRVIALIGIGMWLDIRGTIKSMSKSLEILTVQMAAIIARVDSHEQRINKLEG